MNFRNLLINCAAFSLVAFSAAQAEELKGDKESLKAKTRMDAVVVSATRTKEKAIDVSGSATMVGRDQIEMDEPLNISEILEDIPGMDVSGGGLHSNQPALRGLPENQTIIKIDGARQNYVQKAGDPQSTILVDPEILKNVEVIRGPSSTMHGGGGIGGVISLKTMDAQDLLKPGQKIGAKIKSGFRTGDESISYSGTAFGRFGDFDILANSTYRKYGDYDTSSTDKDHDETNIEGSSLNNLVKLAYLPSEERRFQINLMNYKHDYKYPYEDKNYESEQDRIIGKFESSSGKWLNLKTTAMYSKRDETQTTPSQIGEIENDLEFKSFGLDLQNTMNFNAFSMDHIMVAGFDYYRDEYQPKTSDEKMAWTNPPGDGDDLGLFVQDEISITDTIKFTPGLRYTYFKRSGDKSKAEEGDDSRLCPKAVLDWTPAPWFGVYLGYSEAFRPPLVSEMYTELNVAMGIMKVEVKPNPNLKPETAKNWETGVRFSFNDLLTDNDALRIKGSFFKEKIENLIEIVTIKDFDPPNNSFERIVTTANLDSVNRHGIEIEAAYANPYFDLSAGYSKVKGHDNDSINTTNNKKEVKNAGETPGVFNIRADFKLMGPSLKLGLKSKFVESFTDTDNDYYHNHDIHSISLRYLPQYSMVKGLAVNLGVTNIFDREYEAYHFKDSSAGMARSFYTSLSYKF